MARYRTKVTCDSTGLLWKVQLFDADGRERLITTLDREPDVNGPEVENLKRRLNCTKLIPDSDFALFR
jgi:hypothetical protein